MAVYMSRTNGLCTLFALPQAQMCLKKPPMTLTVEAVAVNLEVKEVTGVWAAARRIKEARPKVGTARTFSDTPLFLRALLRITNDNDTILNRHK